MDDGAGSDPGQRERPEAADGSDSTGTSSRAQPDLRQVARDWIDLWESELSALAVDREAREAWRALMPLWTGPTIASAAWAGAITAALRATMGQPDRHRCASDDDAHRHTRTEPAARPAPAAPASDARDDEVERLTRNVAELEARLAALERDRNGAAGGSRKRKR